MKFLGMSAKMAALEIAGMGIAMVAVHAAFATGRFLMKAYQGAMKMAAGGAAGLAIALGTVAAAMREQQAAMFAFSAKGQAKEFGSGVNQARVQIRALTMDADLATVGVENLMAAYGAVTKTSRFTAQSQKTLKGLMDFAAAGQDLKTGTKAAGDFLSVLQDTKKSYSQVVEAGKKLSPQMKKALEEFQKNNKNATKAELTKAITSGELAKLGGVEGQFSAVSGTLIGTLKGQFNLLRGLFADFGQDFLEPIKKEGTEVFRIIRDALNRMSGDVADFGQSGFIDKISVVVQKISDWVVRIMRDYLPNAVGIFERIGDWWDRFVYGWNKLKSYLEPFVHGAKVVEGILKNAWLPIWEQIKDKMYTFNNEIQQYQPTLLEFGTNIGNLVAKIMEYGSEVRKIFLEALPFINKVIKGFTDLIELFTSFLGKFTAVTSKLGGGLGSMSSIMMLIGLARGMKNTKGYFTNAMSQSGIREVANMSVNAGTIYINGAPIANYGRADFGGTGKLSPNSNNINGRYGPAVPRGGPYSTTGPGGGATGSSSGFASRGGGRTIVPHGGTSAHGSVVSNVTAQTGNHPLYGKVKIGAGPNGGDLVTSGQYKGKEILSQRVQGKSVQYLYDPAGDKRIDRSQAALTGRIHRSGVTVDPSQRMNDAGTRKLVTAQGRIINRRERFARFFGEGQRLGATGYVTDARMKNFADRFMGTNNNGINNRTALGRMFDAFRNRQVRKSKYLEPTGLPSGGAPPAGGTPPPGGGTPPPVDDARWMLSSNKGYGRGTWGTGWIGRKRKQYYDSAFYNNWMAKQSNIGDNGPIQRGRSPIGRLISGIQGARIGARNIRASRLGAAFLGSETRKGFQGSATGTMGTMLGLGMLANYAAPEAQGFLSAGSMVGMMNPLAGLAIGLGGTAMTAKTLGGGALSGAGAGAAIGSMIAPGIGTVIGGIIGSAVGGAMGVINKAKDEKKKVKEAMTGMLDQVIVQNLKDIQFEMMSKGFAGKSAILAQSGEMSAGIKGLQDLYKTSGGGRSFVEMLYKRRADFGIEMTTEQRDQMLKRPEEAGKVLDKQVDKLNALDKMNEVYGKRLKELTTMTGKSEMEVEKMAMEMGVNLYDATVDFNTILEKLGVTTKMTREQMRGLQMDMAIKGLSQFDEQIKTLEMPKVLSEQGRAFRDLVDAAKDAGDTVSDKDILTFFKDMIPNLLNYSGGGLQGLFAARKALGVGGTEYSRKQMVNGVEVTSPLYGLENLFTQGAAGQQIQGYLNTQIATQSRQLGGNLNSMLINAGGTGPKFQVNSDLFGQALASMDESQAAMLTSAIQSGGLFRDYNMEKLTMQDIQNVLASFGMNAGALGLRQRTDDDELTIAIDKMPDDLRTTYEGIIKMFGTFFDQREKNVPEWMTNEFIKARAAELEKDTYSPRGKGIGDTVTSRLSQTMARHSEMNGMLTGKRTVTSAWRNWGLGSPSSDHVTGRAYDLTGQNLGGYARLVRAGGGFAEFHGRNAGRHLHVVPGPGPYGDTGMPSLSRVSMPTVTGGGTTIQITQNIQGGPNASAEEVAKIAVREMKMVLDNERQRA